ncbi:unnamed protein product, partial [Owenia fusiformis]
KIRTNEGGKQEKCLSTLKLCGFPSSMIAWSFQIRGKSDICGIFSVFYIYHFSSHLQNIINIFTCHKLSYRFELNSRTQLWDDERFSTGIHIQIYCRILDDDMKIHIHV